MEVSDQDLSCIQTDLSSFRKDFNVPIVSSGSIVTTPIGDNIVINTSVSPLFVDDTACGVSNQCSSEENTPSSVINDSFMDSFTPAILRVVDEIASFDVDITKKRADLSTESTSNSSTEKGQNNPVKEKVAISHDRTVTDVNNDDDDVWSEIDGTEMSAILSSRNPRDSTESTVSTDSTGSTDAEGTTTNIERNHMLDHKEKEVSDMIVLSDSYENMIKSLRCEIQQLSDDRSLLKKQV